MTQIVIVQPAAPNIPPAGPPAAGPPANEKQQFSTHFEKAISDKKNQLNSRENGSSNQSQKSSDKQNPDSATTDIAGPDSPSSASAQDIATENTAVDESAEVMVMQNLMDALLANEIPTDTTFLPTSLKNTTLTGDLPNTGKEAALPLARILTPGINTSVARPSLSTELTDLAEPPARPATDALLVQLEQIINNSNEKGQVSIAKVDNSLTSINDGKSIQVTLAQPLTNSTGQIQSTEINSESPVFVLAEGFKLPMEKSDHQLGSLRQNTQQQYYEAKINLQSTGKEDAMPQDPQQGGESGTSASTAGMQNSTAAPITGEQTNTFTQTLTAVQDAPSLPASEPAKTVTLPSGIVVHEEEVMQQVLERFQLNKRPQDTQINIKLHPAELGELSIDLTVKEGSIRAHVMAQSQHAQEIIEKNMMKLRTVLEDQGFTIETITVTSKPDSAGDSNLFDRQLFSRDDYTPQSGKRRNSGETAFRLEEAFLPTQPATTGVNVKI